MTAIAKAIQMKQGVLDIESQVTDRTDQVSAITQEQERIRAEHEDGRPEVAVL